MSLDVSLSDMSFQSTHTDFVSGILPEKRVHYIYNIHDVTSHHK